MKFVCWYTHVVEKAMVYSTRYMTREIKILTMNERLIAVVCIIMYLIVVLTIDFGSRLRCTELD